MIQKQKLGRTFALSMRSNIFVALATSLVALPLLFSTLAPYDDEGYVMMTIRSFSEGHRLYADTFTQYGPAYYFWTEPLHSILGWPLTQDAVRLKTAIIWIVSCMLVYQVVLRVGGSRSAAIVTAVVCAVHLEKLALEPGHPQELVLLFGLITIRLVTEKGNQRWWLAGILTAVVGLTKINCGVVLALALFIASTGVKKWPRGWLSMSLIAISALLPLGLVLQTIRAGSLPWLAIQLTLSLAAVAWAISSRLKVDRRPVTTLTWPRLNTPFMQVAAGGVLGSCFILCWSLANGNTPSELWFGIVGQHTQFTEGFFHPIRVSNEFAGIALVLLFISSTSVAKWRNASQSLTIPRRISESRHSWKLFIALFVWLFVVMLVARSLLSPLHHGLEVRGAAIWLSVVGPAIAPFLFHRIRLSTARVAIAVLACLSPLIAFPTPGTQLSIGTVPGLIVAGIVLSDVFVAFQIRMAWSFRGLQIRDMAIRTLVLFGILLIPLSSGAAIYRYMTNVPLNLAGASWMRLDATTVAEQQAIVQAIQESHSQYLAFDGHNHNRFYFWTRLRPISAMNPTFWPRLLSDKDLSAQKSQIEHLNRVCVVVDPEVEALTGVRASEFRQSLVENWSTVKRVGKWTIGVRENEQPSSADGL
jgi:hypothetical protein